MKCVHCGFENEQEVAFCVKCGASAQATAPVSEHTVASKVLSALKNDLFLVICILVSASAAFSLANEQLPLLTILATIFLWIVYAKARKDAADGETLRCLSGTIFAHYVVMYVVVGCFVLAALLFLLVFALVSDSAGLIEEIINEFGVMEAEYIDLIELFLSLSGLVAFLIFALLAVPVFLLNFFGMRKIHGFVKSVYQSVQYNVPAFQHIKAAQTWLMVFGILSAISACTALSASVASALSGGCSAAAMIVASILVRKSFAE